MPLLTWTAYLLMACEGYLIYAVGFIAPFLRHDLGAAPWMAALPNSAMAAGLVGASMLTGRLNNRIGQRAAVRTWAALMGLAALLLAIPISILPILVGATLFGTSIGGVLVHVNSALGEGRRGGTLLTRANLWSVAGGLAGPLVLSAAATGIGWWYGLLAPVPFLAVLALVLPPSPARDRPAVTDPDRLAATDRERPATPDPARRAATARLDRGAPAAGQPSLAGGAVLGGLPRAYWLSWLFMTLLIGAEFSFVVWGSQVVSARAGIGDVAATGLASLYVAGMIAGRLALSTGLASEWRPTAVLRASTILAVAGAALTLLATEPTLAGLGLLLGGLGISPAYPLGASLAIMHAPGTPVLASARLTAASGAAIFSAPLGLGLVVGLAGVIGAWLLVLAMLALGLIVILRVPPPAAAPDQLVVTAG